MAEFKDLDPLLHSQLRLGIMSILISAEFAEFTFLKDKTSATAGNLSVQLDKLQKARYINITKGYKGKRPVTTCEISSKGRKAFTSYVVNLGGYINPKK